MAFSSSEKTINNPSPPPQPPPPPRTPSTPSSESPLQTHSGAAHVALPRALIQRLRSVQNWGEKYRWMYDDERIRRVWEIQHNMDVNDLLNYVIFGEGEEVVWDDDVWNLQHITHTPEDQKEPPQPKMAEINAPMDVDGYQPSSPTAESPNTTKDTDID